MRMDENEEELLRSVALQNARAVFMARERAERELIAAKEALERKSLELEQQREFFRVTLASIADAVITTDIAAKVTYINPVAKAMTGWESEDAIGQDLDSLFNVVNEHSREIAPNPVRRVLREGTVVGSNYTILITRDGREIAIDDSAAPIRDFNGNIVGVVMIFHDVTKQRLAETELRDSNQRVTNILESITDGFIVLDEKWRFTHVNRQAEEIIRPINKSRASVLGKDYWQEFPDLIGTDLETNFRHAATKHVKVEFELFYSPLNSWFEIRAYPTPDGLSVYFLDVTKRKLAAEALRQSERLAASGRLAATVAHEINNPLEGIMNLLFLLSRNLSLDEKAKGHLVAAQEEVARLAHISRQTLGFYRDSTAPTSVDISKSIEQILFIYKSRIQAKGIQVRRQFDESACVTGFAGEIRQVFSNLVVNAFDALDQHGLLTVRVRWTKRDGTRGVAVTLADSGCGIDPNHRQKVFEPFYTTKKDVGTGLGLWLTREIVAKHSGTIRVRSSTKPGETGTIFSIFLPQHPSFAGDTSTGDTSTMRGF